MRVLFKYFFWLLSFCFLFIYFLLGTTLGHLTIGHFSEDFISKKLNNKVEVIALNIEHYPHISLQAKLNEQSIIDLTGEFDFKTVDMKYDLKGDTFQWNRHVIAYPTQLSGSLKGGIKTLGVVGKGSVFDGNTEYSFIVTPKRLENISLDLEEVNATQLLTFLNYQPYIQGRVDIISDFEYYTSYKKSGTSNIRMEKAILPKLSKEIPFSMDAKVKFKDLVHEFFIDFDSEVAKLRLANAHLNKAADLFTADYGIQIKELAYFEPFLKHRFFGVFNAAGTLHYDREVLEVKGDTNSFEGLIEYSYKNHYLDLVFERVSLEKLLKQLGFPALLSSKVFGTASYDLKDEIILINTELKETRFRATKMVSMIYEVTGIDILKDVYNNSLFSAGYQDSILTSFLQIDNGVNHLYLRDTRMNSITNEITSDFEVKLDGEKFFGDIYGTLENPQVNVDMSKVIKYQINKKIENFFGQSKAVKMNSNEEILEDVKNEISQTSGALDVENIKKKTRDYLDGFFN